MRNMMWIYATFILLFSEAWSLQPAVRHLLFNLGSGVNLTCSDNAHNETLYVIWTLNLRNKVCKISFTTEGQRLDECNDSKSLEYTSSAKSYLHIPEFSDEDVGVYRCEWVYRGGSENYQLHIDIAVPPIISAWLEHQGKKAVARCKAERGKPAANISWSHTGNSSPVESQDESNGYFTVESRLELLEGMDNLSCAIRHPYWEGEKVLVPKRQPFSAGYVPWIPILTAVIIFVFLAGFLFFALKKVMRQSQRSDTSPCKSPPTEDVEEVEPYASYVQRVNSIYNSSADLFT